MNNTILINDEFERMQLIRALMQRIDCLEAINPITWDDSDTGSLEECRNAVRRLLRQAKSIKLGE